MVRCLYCMQVVAEDSARACPHCGHVIPLRKENVLDLEPGTMLGGGRYLIGRSIGYGGFGRTYLAWDANLNTVCAVKEYYPQQLCTRVPHSSNVMVNSLNDRPGYDKGRKAFQEEAMRLLALSNVPGIVRVWDRFSENNTEYFVMELLQGGTLSKPR